MNSSKFPVFLIALSLLWGCTSVKVEKLDPENPQGVPFYLTKPMVETTTIEYVFIQKASNAQLTKYTSRETKIVNVIDKDAAYTINHTRAFAGESTLKLNRSAASEGISSSDLASVEVVNKEGITEFLKGLFEGSKQISEAAKTFAEAGAVAGALTKDEAAYFNALLAQGIVVTKQVVSVTYTDL